MNNQIQKRKYRIVQNVVVGPRYTEHHYPVFSSNFIGRWQRYGGKVEVNDSVEPLFCDYCFSDYFTRQTNRRKCNILENSYQVEGLTYSLDKWDWDYCICRNGNNCWGPSERLFDLKRKKNFYQMTQTKVLDGVHEQVEDKIYFEMKQKSNYPKRFTGIANRFTRPSFFWPNLFDGQPRQDGYIFHVDNQTNLPLPPHMRGSPFCSLPKVYQVPEYMFVNNFTFEIFRRNPEFPWPTNLWESKLNHHPVAITTLDLYPGGSGFKCKQLKFLVNQEFDKSVKSSSDVKWTEKEYIWEREAFIPNKQDGYAGPITSYYHRINCVNPYFS